MLLKNADVLLGDFSFSRCDIQITAGKIEKIMPCGFLEDADEIDCSDKWALPGLIDIHTHGACGVDTMDATIDALNRISTFMAQNGVTSFLPTSMTMDIPSIEKAFSNVRTAYETRTNGANIVGINMEGPYINPDRAGAQDSANVRPANIDEFRRLNALSGHLVKLVTVAPEMPENLAFIREVVKDGVAVSCGHSSADYDTIMEAYQNGSNHMTHLYNAMTPLTHRDPNAVGAAFTSDSVYCELICDGVHIHKAAVLTAYHMKGADKMILISDSMMAAGLGDGEYNLGGLPVIVSGGVARIKEGNLAGSCAKLISCVKKAIEFGIPVPDAVKMASLTPAKSIGIAHQKGSIEIGKDADIIITDHNLCVESTIIGGKIFS
jgi:N-acetylglucosamine-6-phosphate deacetylase